MGLSLPFACPVVVMEAVGLRTLLFLAEPMLFCVDCGAWILTCQFGSVFVIGKILFFFVIKAGLATGMLKHLLYKAMCKYYSWCISAIVLSYRCAILNVSSVANFSCCRRDNVKIWLSKCQSCLLEQCCVLWTDAGVRQRLPDHVCEVASRRRPSPRVWTSGLRESLTKFKLWRS